MRMSLELARSISSMKRSQSAASALHVGGGGKARAAANAAAMAPAQPVMDPLYPPGFDCTGNARFPFCVTF
jgi:hypothetical protein